MATVTSSKRHLLVTSDTYTSNGDVTVGGDLFVNGSQTVINTATLNVEDKNISLNYGGTEASSQGSGITIVGSNATLIWDEANTRWVFSDSLVITDHAKMASGNVSGKFAVKSTGVHASYDFYNEGTSYFNDAVTIDADLTLSGGVDILMSDNSGAAVEFKQGTDLYMRFITTNGGEHIEVNKNIELQGMTATSGTFSGTLSASNLSGTNTGDQTNISGNAGTATLAANSSKLDGYTLERIDHAEAFHTFNNINAASTQAKRYHIGRLYGCPAHWDGDWQNIEFNVTAESYESGHLRYKLMGDYGGSGSQANMMDLYLKEASGPMVGRFRFVLGTPVDAGWDHSGQDTFYVDLYAEAAHYSQWKINIKTYGHGTQNSNPTSGGAVTVFYDSPTVTNVSTFNENHLAIHHLENEIYHEGHKPTPSEIGAAPDTVVNQTDFVSAANGGTFSGDVQAPGIYVGTTNTNFDLYNNGTSYLNGATTVGANLTVNGDLLLGNTAQDPKKVIISQIGVDNSETSSLMLDGNGAVVMRNLGSGAFASTPTDFVSKANGGTFSGTITTSGGINGLTLSNGISGSNFNITGVNQLEINDPGEGIVFKQGSSGDMTLAIVDDSSDNILRLTGTGAKLQVGSNEVYHEGHKPTPAEIGAAATSHNHDGKYLDRYTGTSSCNNSSFTTAFTVDGGNLSSSIRFSVQGTSNSVVVQNLIDLVVGHSQDIQIKALSGNYTKLTVKVVSNNNEDFAVEVKHNGSTTTTLYYEVFAYGDETVTFTSSHSFTGNSLEKELPYGNYMAGAGGDSGDLEINGVFRGDGSGLTSVDAATVDGKNASDFASVNHTHSNYITSNAADTATHKISFTASESIGLKGARGAFTNEYIHLYNKVGIGHPSGWGQGETDTPNQGLSTYGGMNISYGTKAASTICGNLNIGTASDTGNRDLFLHGSTANKKSRLRTTNGNLHIDSADGNALYLNYYYGASTNIYFGTGNGGSCGTVSSAGLLRMANDVVAYYSFSDRRLKTNIKTTENNLEKILSLNPVEYTWKEGPREGVKEIGLIAQEVEEVVPEVVRVQSRHHDEKSEGEEYKQVDYEHLVSTLIGAMQEQQKQIDELKAQMAACEARSCDCKK